MHIYNHIKNKIQKIILDLYNINDFHKIIVEDGGSHGDIATNAALVICKELKRNPMDIAIDIKNKLLENSDISEINIAKPGFINIILQNTIWHNHLLDAVKSADSYGELPKNGKKVNIEFVSVNPTGPLHAGHARNAVFGDVLASILEKAGFDVVREYYINDAGGQIKAIGKSIYLRYKELHGIIIKDSDFDKDMYVGKYLIPVAQKIKEIYGDKFIKNPDLMEFFEDFGLVEMMNIIKEDLDLLGIKMDVYSSEKQILPNINIALEKIKNDIYLGHLEKPKEYIIEDNNKLGQQLIFKSTQYGDDTDRVIKKSCGDFTYFAGDIAYHFDKINRNFDKLINVFGADHSGYVKRLEAIVKSMESKKDFFTIKICQMVNFLENGKPVRMSKRTGTFVTIRDVVEKVGVDATRFMLVSRNNDTSIDFDFEKVIEQTKDNPVFYVQYAHARICSVLRHFYNIFPTIYDNFMYKTDLSLLTNAEELSIIKTVVDFPRAIDMAAQALEPHRIASYLYNLASLFHHLWSIGNKNATLRFIDTKNQNITNARITLLIAVKNTIASGLKILGMKPVSEM